MCASVSVCVTHGCDTLFPWFRGINKSGLDPGHDLVQVMTGIDLEWRQHHTLMTPRRACRQYSQ